MAIGNRVHPAMQAAQALAEKGVDCGVINMRFVHPLDTQLIEEALKLSRRLVTVEDNMLAGGFGSAVAEYLADKQADFKLLRLGIGDEFVETEFEYFAGVSGKGFHPCTTDFGRSFKVH